MVGKPWTGSRNGAMTLWWWIGPMPEMNGDQLTAAIKKKSPQTPVIMITGFADMPVEGADTALQPDVILRKPIAQMTLRQAIARVMAPAPPTARPARDPRPLRIGGTQAATWECQRMDVS